MTGAHVSEHATLQITNYTSLDNRDRRMYAGLLGVQSVKKGGLDFVFIVFMFYSFMCFGIWKVKDRYHTYSMVRFEGLRLLPRC